MASRWEKQKERYDLLAVRFPKELTILKDVDKIARAMSKTRRIWPAHVAKIAIVQFVYSWKRDHGMTIPAIRLKTR